ncbi:hypothetical protein SM033_00294 [Vibrio phage vB_VpaM_sm033]|nr:hypothetical protein SM033_00294 [Vibrio phage vB_VpaM_sm033]
MNNFTHKSKVLNTTTSLKAIIAHICATSISEAKLSKALRILTRLYEARQNGNFLKEGVHSTRFVLRNGAVALAAFDDKGERISNIVTVCESSFHHYDGARGSSRSVDSLLATDTDKVVDMAIRSLNMRC